ncbi:MAG: hypothetical protein AAFO95_10160 [Cyanobacteria bacterium J06600_6]
MTVIGTVEKKGFGFGTWALVSEDGTTYELKDAAEELKQDGIRVEIKGKIREDVMTIAMIGAVLEVESYQIL